MTGLVVLETHPIQYHAPVYRAVQARFDIPVSVVYGSDFSISGYRDDEFGATFAWDTDLLSGYHSLFLTRVVDQRSAAREHASVRELVRALRSLRPEAILLVGYRPRFHQIALVSALLMRVPLLFRGETTDHARQRTALCVDQSTFLIDEAARDNLRATTRAYLNLDPAQLAFLFSGKLIPRKGPDLFLSALHQMPAQIRARSVAIFLGSGDGEHSLREQAVGQPGLQTRFLGFQNQSQLSAIYHAADAVVLPSRTSETWGLVINEGLHHGLPCVVSEAVGCAPDLVHPGRTGEICATGSVVALCRAQVAPYSVEAAARGIAEAFSGARAT